MGKTPDRFIWGVEKLSLHPDAKVLEIGCGTGLFAEQILAKLPKGHLTAIDQSASMIEKARKRNKVFIESGRAAFHEYSFLEFQGDTDIYDTIVAFNVNLFLKGSEAEFCHLKRMMKPEGELFVFYQFPFDVQLNATEPIRGLLEKYSFNILEYECKRLLPTPVICVKAGRDNLH